MLGFLLAAVLMPSPVGGPTECYDYDLFTQWVPEHGGKIVSTIETPNSPTAKRQLVVEYQGTREYFAGLTDCVMVPPVFVDAPDSMVTIPTMPLLPPKQKSPPGA